MYECVFNLCPPASCCSGWVCAAWRRGSATERRPVSEQSHWRGDKEQRWQYVDLSYWLGPDLKIKKTLNTLHGFDLWPFQPSVVQHQLLQPAGASHHPEDLVAHICWLDDNKHAELTIFPANSRNRKRSFGPTNAQNSSNLFIWLLTSTSIHRIGKWMTVYFVYCWISLPWLE